MEILGIGPLELFFILIIALIFLGPNDMVKAGRTLGRFLRKVVTSPTWHAVQQTSRDLRTLPNKLMRDAGMEEDFEEMKQLGRDLNKEAEMLRSIQNPLREASDQIKQETKVSSPGLSAWTTPAAAIPAVDSLQETSPTEFDQDVVPPAPESTTTGPVEAHDAAPDTGPTQPPTEPNPT